MKASAARKPSNPQFSDIFLRFWRQCNVQIAANLRNAAHNRCFLLTAMLKQARCSIDN